MGWSSSTVSTLTPDPRLPHHPGMDRRRFLLTSLAGALVAPVAAEAQQAGKIWRIGYLSVVSVETDRSWVIAFRDGLRELGYREGENVIVEQRHAAQQLDKLPGLAVDLVRLQVDVVVANGTPAILAAKNAKSGLPIVMTVNADPVGAGLVISLARPGATSPEIRMGTPIWARSGWNCSRQPSLRYLVSRSSGTRLPLRRRVSSRTSRRRRQD